MFLIKTVNIVYHKFQPIKNVFIFLECVPIKFGMCCREVWNVHTWHFHVKNVLLARSSYMSTFTRLYDTVLYFSIFNVYPNLIWTIRSFITEFSTFDVYILYWKGPFSLFTVDAYIPLQGNYRRIHFPLLHFKNSHWWTERDKKWYCETWKVTWDIWVLQYDIIQMKFINNAFR